MGWFAEHYSDLLLSVADFETKALKIPLETTRVDRPGYICGLPRSGTTILLELLAEHPDVATHCYRDYPFVMLPYWWNKFLRRNTRHFKEAVERSHKDGIFVTPESPEAMEEMIWMLFFPHIHDPAVNNLLSNDQSHGEFDKVYTDTINKFLIAKGKRRYIAKNNYNVTRIHYLADLFPNARFIVPIREPVQQIASLMKQHRILLQDQANDQRALSYMRRSGHFEFGLDRRAINLGNSEATKRVKESWDNGREVEGWAIYWRQIYAYITDLLDNDEVCRQRVLVVSHDEMCKRPRAVLERICTHLELSCTPRWCSTQSDRIKARPHFTPDFSTDEMATISSETTEVYQHILESYCH